MDKNRFLATSTSADLNVTFVVVFIIPGYICCPTVPSTANVFSLMIDVAQFEAIGILSTPTKI